MNGSEKRTASYDMASNIWQALGGGSGGGRRNFHP